MKYRKNGILRYWEIGRLSGLVMLLGLISCKNVTENESNSAGETTQKKIEEVKLAELDGSAIEMSQFEGKTVFLNFWATWCKPCLQEMPSIQRMMEKLKGEDIVFLFASDESPEQIETFKNRFQYPFHYVRAENPEELNIMALPTTFIFNASGKLSYDEMGYRQWDSSDNLELVLKIAK